MTFGSLFAGIGGLDLGLERAGMECRWQVEIDEYCQKVLHKHWPDVPKYGDIFDVDFTQVEPVDLICGGFPCQPFSVAGKRRGAKDERYLWPEFARAIREARPEWVLLENVPGLLAMAGEFGQVLADLASCGFDAEWDCIPAAAVGAPHLRYRVFVVAHARHHEPPGRAQLAEGVEPKTRSIVASRSLVGTEGKVAHAQGFGRPQPADGQGAAGQPAGGGEALADTESVLPQGQPQGQGQGQFGRKGWWSIEPNVGRVANGVPARVDRLKCLGNAVVPAVAEWIGLRIVEANHD